MRCETALKELDRYRTGETPGRLGISIAEHLSSCPECASELDDLRRVAASLSRLGAPAPQKLVSNVLEKTMDGFGAVETEVGRVWVGFNARGITMVHLETRGRQDFVQAYLSRRFRTARAAEVPAAYASHVRSAAAGTPPERVPLDLDGLTRFEQRALLLLRRIPRGEVRPYSWVAREAGNPSAVRAVGTAMARNPLPLLLPCHRVVPLHGGVGNYAFGSRMKRILLEREGVPVREFERLARKGVRYLGCKSTGIYCFPTCRDARRMKPENRLLFRSADQAAEAGYRPCRHCRP